MYYINIQHIKLVYLKKTMLTCYPIQTRWNSVFLAVCIQCTHICGCQCLEGVRSRCTQTAHHLWTRRLRECSPPTSDAIRGTLARDHRSCQGLMKRGLKVMSCRKSIKIIHTYHILKCKYITQVIQLKDLHLAIGVLFKLFLEIVQLVSMRWPWYKFE